MLLQGFVCNFYLQRIRVKICLPGVGLLLKEVSAVGELSSGGLFIVVVVFKGISLGNLGVEDVPG